MPIQTSPQAHSPCCTMGTFPEVVVVVVVVVVVIIIIIIYLFIYYSRDPPEWI